MDAFFKTSLQSTAGFSRIITVVMYIKHINCVKYDYIYSY